MKVIDAGHTYELAIYDGEGVQSLIFMKREGDGYPFNVGHHAGTNCQEVIRALIDRVKYLDKQIACDENARIIRYLRRALMEFEMRAARRHGRTLYRTAMAIESAPACAVCGHVDCNAHQQSGDRTEPTTTAAEA